MSDFLPPDEKSIFYKKSQQSLFQVQKSAYQQNPQPVQNKIQEQEEAGKTESRPRVAVLEPTPNTTWSLVTAIASLVFSVAFCKWFNTIPALICALISLHLSISGKKMVTDSPDIFSKSGLGNLKTAKTLAIVALGICGFSLIIMLGFVYHFYWSD